MKADFAMRVAVYARYSSEHQREASIDDQIRNCEQYATRQRMGNHAKVFRQGDQRQQHARAAGYQQMLLEYMI
jgi:hypothetical protein